MSVENHHPGSHSKLVSKVESSIRIDSITIDLDNVDEKVEEEKCSHFSMRGYVSEIRKRDWKICWPFVSDGDSNNYEEQACLLPPLHVPKFRFWRCQNCVWEVDAKGTANCHGTSLKPCSTGFNSTKVCSHAPILDDDALLPSDVHGSCKSRKNERKTEDANDSGIGKSVGSEDNLKQENHRLACVATEVVSSPIQKTDHTDKIVAFKSKCINLCEPGCEHREVVAAEFARNLNCMVNNSTEICESGKETSIDEQYKEIIACGASGEAGNIDDGALTADKDPWSRPTLELDEYDDPSSESTDIMVGNNSQDVHHENSSGLHRRRTRKVRLLTELLCENEDGDMDNKTQYSLPRAFPDAPAGADKVPVLQGEVATQGRVRRGLGQNRKRKSPQDEDSRPPEMRSANKVCKESQWPKNKVDRSLVVSKKKNKKALIFDECLSSELSPEKAPTEIGEKIEHDSKATAVDDVLTKSAHNEFTGREMDFFPLHSSQMETNVNDFKKKGKMPLFEDYQVSPTPWNHRILRDGPVIRKDVGTIHTGPVPVPVPFHSAKNTYLEKGAGSFS
ncbi:PROTEIN EMBRYONIC FLOWER 1 [Salix koriyanagi]|uniref:PROTEIN EMBRYONIC FLOWER 1 n=1 Tax=Salix koriyanagi TaxID=2511006 RepID=A0A9Q0VBP0_9ROSI|nr:PROTEIN EMBRYONIC FLOWER 1 [Salix koriyanagi]